VRSSVYVKEKVMRSARCHVGRWLTFSDVSEREQVRVRCAALHRAPLQGRPSRADKMPADKMPEQSSTNCTRTVGTHQVLSI